MSRKRQTVAVEQEPVYLPSEDVPVTVVEIPSEDGNVDHAQPASEDGEIEHKNSSTSSSEVVKITLEAYLRKVSVHPGLVASFRVEAAAVPNGLAPRPMEAWAEALMLQSRRVYMN